MKKLLLFLVTMLTPIMVSAYEYDAYIDGIYYNFDKVSKTASVTCMYIYSNSSAYRGDVIIPATVNYSGDNYKVSQIGESAFRSCSGLTSVTIPNSVTSIGDAAFMGCSSLTTVKIPNSVTSIEHGAFYECSSLISITIPNSITNIGGHAFSETKWYDNQPNGILYLNDWLIGYKGEMPKGDYVIPEGTRGIAGAAFLGCNELTSISFPTSMISIGDGAFSNCSGLTTITIPNNVTTIRDGTFENCSGLTSVTIPNSVTKIESNAFRNCSGLTSVTIPNSVTSIEGEDYWNGAFSGCHGLININIPNSVTSIGDGAFFGCSSLTTVTIPNSVTSIGNGTFMGCEGLTSVIIPNSVTSLGYAAFARCSSLTSATISNNIDCIRGGTFYGCSSLISVIIPNSVKRIENDIYLGESMGAFSNCDNLTSVTIPNSVTNLGDRVFLGCTSLTSVTIPNSVTTIGNTAFYGCSSLTSVNIPNSVTSIGVGAFMKCYNLTSFIIPNNVTSLGNNVFRQCTNLLSVTIPNSVTKICYAAFYGCSSLTSITFPNSLKSIEDEVFQGCSSLTSVIIPNSVTTIGENAFENCGKMETLTLPNELQIIKKAMFKGCYNLKSVTIPASVEFIYQEAFANCDALESVKAKPGTPPFLYDNSFSNYSVPLEVPKGCKQDYQTAQGWKNFTNISESDKGYYKLIYLVDNEEYKSYKIEEGTAITPELAPTKDGYTFSGWSEIPEVMPAHDVTVTGTFSINKYKLTYMVDDEEYNSYELDYGASITPEPAPTKEGYTFSGWSEIPETMPAHDLTVTGSFTINKYKLTYMVDGEEYKSYLLDYGASITLETVPTKEGYTFSGWSEIPERMPAHDLTVTGTFTINKYKLTYMVDDEEYKSYVLGYGTTITPETEPTKEGYTFSGWSEIPETMPAHDVTVTGSFTINSYKLTYMIDDKVYKETMYKYGAIITPEPQPEGDYATFEWTDLPKTMPAHDVVVYASYTSGIIEVLMTTQRNIHIYSPNGKKLDKLQKGLNIVVLDDGTVKKVVVK
ncbi:MAG: leucine-rich repeat protein [Prevotella sp.]|nr:leucine-rich repeat protein [Prevotella sp.]